MFNLVVGEIMHESSTFSNQSTETENFKTNGFWYVGDDVYELSRMGTKDFITGIIDKAAELGMNVINTFAAAAPPSGKISANCYAALKRNLIEGVKRAGKIDGLCLALHGAGVSEIAEDIEGDLLQSLRECLGYEIPIIITLDLHANITDKMAKEATLLLLTKLYPHTDTYQTGEKAVCLMDKILKKQITITTSMKKIPLLLAISKGCTEDSPLKEINGFCAQFEKEPQVLDCSFAHGFPYSDIQECGASVYVATDNNGELAEKIALQVVDYIWRKRAEFKSNYKNEKEALDYAEQLLRQGEKTIVINEISDNPGAGTPGDGTYLLKELLARNIPQTCFAAIVDVDTVLKAIKSGVGTFVDVELGGKTDELHGKPIPIEKAYVKTISEGKYNLLSPMTKNLPVNFGPSVRLQKDNLDIIVASISTQIMDDGLFSMHGINVSDYNVIGIKSAQHFKAHFTQITRNIIPVDSPGISTGNLGIFNYKHVTRPIYPLDDF